MLQSVSRMASFIKIRWASESIVKENSTKNLFLAINKPSRRSTYISLKSPEYSSNSRTRFDADGHKFLAQAKSRLLDFWLVFCFGPGKVFGDGIIKKERDTHKSFGIVILYLRLCLMCVMAYTPRIWPSFSLRSLALSAEASIRRER
jgi:hypothetical protein